jgi:diguanylate cyclase (GGDEF)-like protein
LSALRNHIGRIHAGSKDIEVFNVSRQDELGELSRDFYKLSQQRRQAESAAAALARTDSLTGIANRRMFEECLAMTLERGARSGTWTGIAYLDIDHFKKINDAYGHAVGDAVLVEFALRLCGAIRKTDMVARLAGDEFVVIFECVAGDHCASGLGAKIIEAMAAPFDIGDKPIQVTSSVGIAMGAPGRTVAEALLRDADDALYQAKREGRNRFAINEDKIGTPVS